MKKYRNLLVLIISMIALMLPANVTAVAQNHESSNYSVEEAAFSSGSSIDSTSASYQSRLSSGDLAVGQAESTKFQTYAGPISPDDEYVELVIPNATIDLGKLQPGTPSYGVASFSARAYINDNYSIISPRNGLENSGGYVFKNITSTSAVDPAKEQFGMNLVANTSPALGGNALVMPNATFAYGQAATGYDQPNQFKYTPGDTLAKSVTRGYGETIYTITYVANATSTTPAGEYRMEQDLVMTATF